MSAVRGVAERPSAVRAGRREAPRELLFAGVHLFVLSALAVAQPLFDLLSRSPEFFVVRGSTRLDVVVFALAVIVLPPALLLGIEALAGLAGGRARSTVHHVFVALLVALLGVQVLKRLLDAPALVLLAAAVLVGAAAALAYGRVGFVRSMLTVLGPAPLVFAGLFLLASPVSKITLGGTDVATAAIADDRGRPPVVLVLLDELPITSLMDERGGIDAVRFPNFARLAAGSTWYQNATTVHEHSTEAVPAILTGNYPEDGQLPFTSDHPRNIFTLLGGAYRLEVFEAPTRLCPTELCPRNEGSFASRMKWLNSDLGIVYLHMLLPEQYADRLPPVTQTWMNFGGGGQTEGEQARARFERDIDVLVGHEMSKDQALQFETFIASIEEAREPTLYFLDVMLPHSPWWYLPSGRRYTDEAGIRGIRHDRWTKDPWLVEQGFQRHLVTTQFVDRLLGRLLDRLEATGLYDRSVLVLLADHGVSFLPGERRRGATDVNLHDIAFVPLFVKAPNQKKSGVVDTHVRTIDVFPSIADLVDVDLPWKVDGRSFVDPAYRPDPTVRVFRRAGESTVEEPVAALAPRRQATLHKLFSLFGSGREGDLYAIGPHAELLGRPVETLRTADSERSVDVDDEERFGSVDLTSSFVPAEITGWLDGDASRHVAIAVAVNGRIAAVTRTFRNSGRLRFAALAPEVVFENGPNEVEVYIVSESQGGLRLERLRQ